MKISGIYIVIFSGLCLLIILIFDLLLMPIYVRMDQGRYMVNVTNKKLEYAQKILMSEGYRSLVSDTLFSASYEAGMVVDQYPAPSAELALNQIGLEIDTVYEEYNSDVPPGNVTWQYPKGGDMLNKGMGLHLTISLGVPPNFYQVPNLFGLSKKKAVADLERAGFKLGKTFYRQNEDLIPYTVLDQSIAAETVLEKPTNIDLTISVLTR